ncbi:MAG: hypothetical protein ABJM86_01245 [Hyphomicrobiales bacterium]
MTAATENRFIHSNCARYLGLAIGVGALAFLFINWESEIKEFYTSVTDGEKTPIVQTAGEQRVKNDNPALAACLEERVGHVGQMKADGVINDHQAEQFASRARSLCHSQNPG